MAHRSGTLPAAAVAAVCLLFGFSPRVGATKPVSPREFGLNLPAGEVVAGDGERVLTATDSGDPVVGKVHCRVGNSSIVLLPDGKLVARPPSQAAPTDRRFQPLSLDDVEEQMLAILPGFRTKKTRHYLFIYNTSERFAEATSSILESMIPGMIGHAKSQKIRVRKPEVPLVAIMFRTPEEFQKFRSMPSGVVAYYHTLTNRIVMYEESTLARTRRDLAIQQAISTIAHEGAHQILHNIGVQQRLSVWPMWLSEGIAEYYAPTTFGAQLRWKGAGQVNDMRMFELEVYLKSREADQPSGQIVQHTVSAGRLTSTGYAAAWSLTHYLARQRRANFYRFVKEVSELGPLETTGDPVPPGVITENVTLFEKHFGDDMAQVERKLIQHLKHLPYNDPFASWPHYVATITLPGRGAARRDANLFHTPDMAQKWIEESLESATAEQRSIARSEIREFRNRPIAERYVRQWLATGR